MHTASPEITKTPAFLDRFVLCPQVVAFILWSSFFTAGALMAWIRGSTTTIPRKVIFDSCLRATRYSRLVKGWFILKSQEQRHLSSLLLQSSNALPLSMENGAIASFCLKQDTSRRTLILSQLAWNLAV